MKQEIGAPVAGAVCRRVFRAAAVALAGLGIALAVRAQMSIPGQFAVNQTGAATYTIPIQVPPGVAGMEPKLALMYTSQGGNGLLGVGWSLAGLSAITRCPQTAAQDGPAWVGGVSYKATDRFCLDGQRLVNVPNPTGPADAAPGTYGADQTYYATERESFSRVQSFGVVGTAPDPFTGPSYFIVKTKAGLTMEYGNTADSKILAYSESSGTFNVVRVWALNKVTDTAGNYMTFTYGSVGSQYYPTSINYSGNAQASPALIPRNSVVFTYETRPDQVPRYEGSGLLKNTYRLTKISTRTGVVVPSIEYRIAYSTPAVDVVDGFVGGVSQCDASGACLPATGFSYTAPANTFVGTPYGKGSQTGYWTSYRVANSQPFHLLGDFNGDGKTDFMYWNNTGWTVMTAGSSGWTSSDWGKGSGLGYWSAYGSTSSQRFQFTGDFDGDGKTDYMYWDDTGWRVLLSTGTGWNEQYWGKGASSGYWLGYQSGSQPFHFTGDFNGDGKTDFMYWDGAGWRVLVSTGSGWRDEFWGKGSGAGYWLGYQDATAQGFQFTGDFNGDGKTDFAYWDNTGWRILISTGSGWREEYWGKGNSSGYWVGYQAKTSQPFMFTGDFNGDGKTDIMYLDGPNWRVLLSTGSGWVDKLFGHGDGLGYWSSYLTKSSQAFHFVGDFNGDGKTDFMYWEDSVGWKVLLSTGSGWIPQLLGKGVNPGETATAYSGFLSVYANSVSVPFQFVADFNGDGKTDYMYWDDTQWRLLSNPGLHLMNSVNNGIDNGGINVLYSSPAQTIGNRYGKTTSVTAPRIAVTPTWPVVTDVDRANGVGSTNRTSYWYDTAVVEVGTGRGFTGFSYMQVQDVATGLVNRTYWRQDFPFAGLVDSTGKGTSLGNWKDLGETTNQYTFDNRLGDCLIQPGRRYFVYPSQVDSFNNRDITAAGQSGAGLPGSRTTQAMDSWGNPTQVAVQALGPISNVASGYNNVTTNTYANDVGNWYLGRLLTSATTWNSGASLISAPTTGCISAVTGTGGTLNGGRMTRQPVAPGSGRL